MLGEGLAFPINGNDGVKNFLIGGILSLLGVLIIPAVFVQGYLVRVVAVAVDGGEEPPAFDEWGDLFVDGLKLIVLTIAYVLIPTVLLIGVAAFVGVAALGAGAGPGAEPSAGLLTGLGLVGLLGMFVAVVLLLVAAYLIPAAAANFARNDDLGAAFDLGTVTDAAFTADYLVAALLAFVVSLAVGIVSFILNLIIIGLLLVPFLSFYTQVVTYYLMGRGFAEGLGISGTTGPSSTATYE
ncbi:DUF4013 domain-containing protein [Halorarius halobius]|uniref:DUF4013 domain-containing protein n=1 Tax=Halorarius halobius TaxID=2962671 RepID=UPI0020CF439E|nr:DUF4013 domain-containing protein [Halorarius halobius]